MRDEIKTLYLARDKNYIKTLIWVYLFLLIFEGAIRKWIFPSLSSALLIIRDPVVLLIYYYSLRSYIFPWNGMIQALLLISMSSLTVSLFAEHNTLIVTLYGFRVNFLHFPLIFVMERNLDRHDVLQMGEKILQMMMPMGLLMLFQFLSPSDHWINTAAGGEGTQISGTHGNIRPPGTFSFITGAAEFMALGSAFIAYYAFNKKIYKPMTLVMAAIGLIISMSVCISRLALGYTSLVFGAVLMVVLIRPWAVTRLMAVLVVAFLMLSVLLQVSGIQHGLSTFEERIRSAGEVEGGSQGFMQRALMDYTHAFEVAWEVPLWGIGLGVGTSAGAKLLTGESSAWLAESDWVRIVMESGPIIGLSYVGWRILLCLTLIMKSINRFFKGDVLPLILCSVCFHLILVAQISRPTTLGFTVFGAGLCLASMNDRREAENEDDESA